MKQKTRPIYVIRSVVRACEVLKAFRSGEILSLDEVSRRCRLSRPTVFRILQTLTSSGMLELRGKNRYVLSGLRAEKRRYRFGYASQSEEFSFSRLVSESIAKSAYESGVELITLNNRYSPKSAIRNADIFAQQAVDLVIEFQTNAQSASIVSSRLSEANIPTIAIEIPHPGARYYGANNYRAGVIGGHCLAQNCRDVWQGKVDEVLLVELPMAGPLPRSRLTGTIAGIREVLTNFSGSRVRFINGNGQYEQSLVAVRRYLRGSNARHVLIGAINDPSCLGALRAFEEAGRAENCIAVGQNASIEARHEMRRPGSRLLGSVAYFPEQYGDGVIRLALDILEGKNAPPAVFVKHQLITKSNVERFYPNDSLILDGDSDSMLFSSR